MNTWIQYKAEFLLHDCQEPADAVVEHLGHLYPELNAAECRAYVERAARLGGGQAPELPVPG
ncbi:hypothetical protein [Kitasatospora mediocidica]|uniref:hypothetical protein n=1 Tax=Kitasatospora mediocidica TaxID=58352 RepID=UPI00055B223E|nr:hypothetical protein [Kitasatospora mediocidica]